MIGKIINYGTDALLPDKYKFIGDYTCAVVDGATGDFASAGILTTEGVSENLRMTGNENAALAADVAGAAASVAAGDINKAIAEGNTESLQKAGMKMGAVGASAGIGKTLDDNEGAHIATSVATGSIGKDLNETALKSGLSAAGITAGYKAKGKDGILKGSALGSSTGNLAIDSSEIINKEEIGLEDWKKLKQDSAAIIKNTKDLSEDKAKSKKELREKIKEDQMFEIANKSTDAAFTMAKLSDPGDSDTVKTDEEVAKLIGELGETGNAICRIREKKIEQEGKVYKTTDTLCYISNNYANIKKDIRKDTSE